MKRKVFLNTCLVLVSIVLIQSCQDDGKQGRILNENFDSNDKGWIQEVTEFHDLQIKNGYYFIESKDSGSHRTSSRSLDRSYLYEIPNNYSIKTSIEILGSKLDTAFCGLILESASLAYEFTFYKTGEVRVEEYNFVTQESEIYSEIKSIDESEHVNNFDIELKIGGWYFDLIVNDKNLGRGKISAKNWERLTPFAGKLTSIKIDYLYLK